VLLGDRDGSRVREALSLSAWASTGLASGDLMRVSSCPFVVFSDDWGEHPSSCQHLFRRIARDHDVIWVNTVGMRVPRLTRSDAVKAARKLARMLRVLPASRAVGARPERLSVIQPPMMPTTGAGALARVNDALVQRSVERELIRRGLEQPVVVTTVPSAAGAIERMAASSVVYYRVDDFSKWPGMDRHVLLCDERKLFSRVDLVIAASQDLAGDARSAGVPVIICEHGVDAEHFARRDVTSTAALRSIPEPRVGFFGLLDERIDSDLIARLAMAMSDVQFVLAGPIVAAHARLRRLPNVHLTGPVPYELLPGVVAGLSTLILPYASTEQTRTLAPLKVREYLATGLPLVCTRLPGTVPFAAAMVLPESPQEWLVAIRDSLTKPRSTLDAERRMLVGESWDTVAARFVAECFADVRARAERDNGSRERGPSGNVQHG
jgi:glycosyltransferase involved in cell wall biosynthesis